MSSIRELVRIRKKYYLRQYDDLTSARKDSMSPSFCLFDITDNPVNINNEFGGIGPVISNDLLMEVITSHLAVPDLLRCRLVCKYWSQQFGKSVRKLQTLVVDNEDSPSARQVVLRKEGGDYINVSSLCLIGVQTDCSIVHDIIRNFRSTICGITLEYCDADAEKLCAFIRSFRSLEVLRFSNINPEYRRLRNSSSSALDRITLIMDSMVIPTVRKLEWRETKPTRHIERIHNLFPFLKSLSLKNLSEPRFPSVENQLMFRHLKKLELDCITKYSTNILEVLTSIRLNLETLALNRLEVNGERKLRALQEFLQSISATVVDLSFNRFGFESSSNGWQNMLTVASTTHPGKLTTLFTVPFPKLIRLQIGCTLLTDLKTMDLMPRLEVFESPVADWKQWWYLINRNGIPESEQEQVIYLCLGAIDSGCLSRVLPRFSRLTSLRLWEDRLDDVAFRVICIQLPHLRELTVESGINDNSRPKLQLTDSGITGLMQKDIVTLQDELPLKVTDKRTVDRKRRYPYIGNLTNLRSLEIITSSFHPTDIGILYGISDLRKIMSLSFQDFKVNAVSLNAIGSLPTLNVLSIRKKSGISSKDMSFLKSKNQYLTVIV